MIQETHDSSEDFESSLTVAQLAILRLFADCMDPILKRSAIETNEYFEHRKVLNSVFFFMASIWDDNEEIRHKIAFSANDYWRQFAYNMPFAELHLGQQLHVIACIYWIQAKYINEHNPSFTPQTIENVAQPNL